MSASLDPRWRPPLPWGDRPWTIHEGDNRCALDAYDAESFDFAVTDCPYGLSTELDPPNLERVKRWEYIATEPSGDDRLALPIRELIASWMLTGENPRVTGRGFMGNEWDALVPCPNAWRAAWRVLKPGAYLLTFAGTRTHDLVTLSLRFAGFRVEDQMMWLYGQGIPKRRRLDLAIDTHFGVKDKRPSQPSGYESRRPNGVQGFGMDMSGAGLTSAVTPEAARHVGWDRGLRPGWEPVVVASKPMRGTVAETALLHGTGGMNVDGCRIPRHGRGEPPRVNWASSSEAHGGYGDRALFDAGGGYPANAIIDEEAAALIDAQSGVSKAGVAVKRNTAGRKSGRIFSVTSTGVDATFADEGGASRFFYTAKASSSERDKGLEGMDMLSPGERSGREDDSAGINGYAGTRGEARNPHPTVKPISLMRYLVRLAAPPGAWHEDPAMRPVGLDPFAGSGSTLVAGLVEGVRMVGCELGAKYSDVARRRCQHAYALPREADPSGDVVGVDVGPGQGRLF